MKFYCFVLILLVVFVFAEAAGKILFCIYSEIQIFHKIVKISERQIRRISERQVLFELCLVCHRSKIAKKKSLRISIGFN